MNPKVFSIIQYCTLSSTTMSSRSLPLSTNCLDWGAPLSETERSTRSRSISSENQTMSDMMKEGLQREQVFNFLILKHFEYYFCFKASQRW